MHKMNFSLISLTPLLLLAPGGIAAEPPAWNSPPVFQMNGTAAPIETPAQSRLVSEAWVRVASEPYMIYLPEIHRVLMLISLDYPHRPALIHSDDDGATWSDPAYFGRQFSRGEDGEQAYTDGIALTNMGGGRVTWVGQYRGKFTGQFSYTDTFRRWFSNDDGESWSDRSILVEPPAAALTPGRHLKDPVNVWDPMLVDRDPKTGKTILYETGYGDTGEDMSGGYAWAYLRSSSDYGRTWSEAVQPAGVGRSERSGALPGAKRRLDHRLPDGGSWKSSAKEVDNWQGLGIFDFKGQRGEAGREVKKLYNWGRHHPCMVVLDNGDIVMSHVVRRGYTDDANGYPRFGIEAIVSADNGQTWDLDHKYILAVWPGTIKREWQRHRDGSEVRLNRIGCGRIRNAPVPSCCPTAPS